MALPILNTPTHTTKLPSTGKTIKYRPFLVKEEKILLIAFEGDNEEVITNAMQDIVNNCIITSGVKAEDMPSFDLEYMFLRIRMAAQGHTVELKFGCQNIVSEIDADIVEYCDGQKDISFSIDDIKFEVMNKKNMIINLSDGVGVNMKYPSIGDIKALSDATEDEQSQTAMMFAVANISIDSIFDGDKVYTKDDFTDEELGTWVDNLTEKQFGKIQEFVSNIPTLSHNLDYKCPKCGHENKMELNGLMSFFGYA